MGVARFSQARDGARLWEVSLINVFDEPNTWPNRIGASQTRMELTPLTQQIHTFWQRD